MLFKDEKIYMNTVIRIHVVSNKGTVYTRERMQKAFTFFDEVVKKYSRFDKNSELSILNKNSGKKTLISAELFKLIEKTLEVSKLTNGMYDPTIIDLLELYGYDKKQDFSNLYKASLSDEVVKLTKDRPSVDEIKLNKTSHSITLAKNQRIDLGSIAKGFAVDLAHDYLFKQGFSGFLINAGGDLRSFGTNEKGLPWRVLLYKSELPNHDFEKGLFLGAINLENMAITGSGGWARKVGFFHHLLNPKNGLPINSVTQTYVMAKKAVDADVWSTALYVMGKDCLKLIEERGMEGLLVKDTGEILKTSGFIYDSI